MSKAIIEVEDLGKCYRLGSIGAVSLGDEFRRRWLKLIYGKDQKAKDEFWAIKDVSFFDTGWGCCRNYRL